MNDINDKQSEKLFLFFSLTFFQSFFYLHSETIVFLRVKKEEGGRGEFCFITNFFILF